MALQIPEEGYCQAADVGVLTRAVYGADTGPTIAEVERSIGNASGLINSRLLALGVNIDEVGENERLLEYALLIAARWAAQEVLYSLGDDERASDYYDQAMGLLDRLDRNVNKDGLPFGTTTDDEPRQEGKVYGSF